MHPKQKQKRKRKRKKIFLSGKQIFLPFFCYRGVGILSSYPVKNEMKKQGKFATGLVPKCLNPTLPSSSHRGMKRQGKFAMGFIPKCLNPMLPPSFLHDIARGEDHCRSAAWAEKDVVAGVSIVAGRRRRSLLDLEHRRRWSEGRPLDLGPPSPLERGDENARPGAPLPSERRYWNRTTSSPSSPSLEGRGRRRYWSRNG